MHNCEKVDFVNTLRPDGTLSGFSGREGYLKFRPDGTLGRFGERPYRTGGRCTAYGLSCYIFQKWALQRASVPYRRSLYRLWIVLLYFLKMGASAGVPTH